MSKKQYYVYILVSKRNGTLYAGVTSDPREGGGSTNIRMTWLAALRRSTGSTAWPLAKTRAADDVNAAITREKQLKNWKRAWKTRLIEEKAGDSGKSKMTCHIQTETRRLRIGAYVDSTLAVG